MSFFAKARLLYESCEKSKDATKEHHNAVFVGYDENGVPLEGGYAVERLLPSGKDWNDDILMHQQEQTAPMMQMA